jgi:hypothetical protein
VCEGPEVPKASPRKGEPWQGPMLGFSPSYSPTATTLGRGMPLKLVALAMV